MRKAGFLVLSILATSSADAATVCDGMAKHLRADPEFMSGRLHESPFVLLAKRGVISEPKGEDLDRATAVARLHLSGDAALAADRFVANPITLVTLGHHAMLFEVEGTAHCQAFAFFRTVRGKTEAIAGPPRWMDGGLREAQEGEEIGECYGSSGNLAAMEGVTGFFAEHGGFDGFSSSTDFVPTMGKGWGMGCSLDVETEILYPVKALQLTTDSPLKRDALTKLAPALAKAFVAERKPPHFAYGPPLAASDLAPLKALANAVDQGKAALPLADATALEDEHSIDSVAPVSVDGHAYLLKISHPTMGWRDLKGWRLSFYRLTDGKLAPVAFVDLGEVAGPVKRISARHRP